MSELHQPYSEVKLIPVLELRGIIQTFLQVRKKQTESMQNKGEDCDLVNDDDYRSWGL